MRIRYVWYGVIGVFFLLSFFGIWAMPKDMASAIKAIAPIEDWWSAHAAHPLLAAFALGLAFGTVLLPELWIQIKPHLFPKTKS